MVKISVCWRCKVFKELNWLVYKMGVIWFYDDGWYVVWWLL